MLPKEFFSQYPIAFTDNKDEMVCIGKRIVSGLPDVYTEKVIGTLKQTINKLLENDSTEEKEKRFYQSIYDYWAFGVNIDEEFYYHFDTLCVEEKRGYLNEKNRKLYIYHLNKREDAHLLNNKFETYTELKEYYKRDALLLKSERDYEAFLEFTKKHKEFVVKPTDLALAIGVYKCAIKESEDAKEVFDRLLKEGKQFRTDYKWSNRNNDEESSILIEEVIDQDDRLSKMHPSSINGIRCTTVRVNGKVHLIHPWMKIGVNGEFVTGGAVGSLLACINEKTGVIETAGYNEAGEGFEYHPTTGVRIPGFVIPQWDELLDLLSIIGNHYENINYIGWDMVLSKNGWCIMEANFTGECMWQLMYGRGMKQELEDLLQWKPNTKFWWE